MKNSGFIIRYHRTSMNISQDDLSAGICAPSYLSKIESNEVVPSDEIIQSLLGKLGINILETSSVMKQLLSSYVDKILGVEKLGNVEELTSYSEYFLKSDSILQYLSILYAAGLNDKAYLLNKHNTVSHRELSFYYLCSYLREKNLTMLAESIHLYETGAALFYLGLEKMRAGNLEESKDCHTKALELFVTEGRINGMISCKKQLAILEYEKENYLKSKEIFISLQRMLALLDKNKYSKIIDHTLYNIELCDYMLGTKNKLEIHLQEMVDNNISHDYFPYYVLGKIKMENGKRIEAVEVLLKGVEIFKSVDNEAFEILNYAYKHAKDSDYPNDHTSLEELRKLYDTLSGKINKMVYNDVRNDLISYYKKSRRYKDIVNMMEL